MKVCAVEGCQRKNYAKSYCEKHYCKFKKYGDPNKGVDLELHGMKNKSEYNIWVKLKQRCLNKNDKSYKNYGGRGITVCDEWKNSFLAFYNDMGPRPNNEYSIDRIDNDKGYSKENCRWADRMTQARNTRIKKSNKSGYAGVSWKKSNKKWVVNITVNTKQKYIGIFKEKKDAIKARKNAENKYWKL